jgi:hypothetical protein
MKNVRVDKHHDLATRGLSGKRVVKATHPDSSQRRGEVRGFVENQFRFRTGAAWPAARH